MEGSGSEWTVIGCPFTEGVYSTISVLHRVSIEFGNLDFDFSAAFLDLLCWICYEILEYGVVGFLEQSFFWFCGLGL